MNKSIGWNHMISDDEIVRRLRMAHIAIEGTLEPDQNYVEVGVAIKIVAEHLFAGSGQVEALMERVGCPNGGPAGVEDEAFTRTPPLEVPDPAKGQWVAAETLMEGDVILPTHELFKPVAGRRIVEPPKVGSRYVNVKLGYVSGLPSTVRYEIGQLVRARVNNVVSAGGSHPAHKIR